MNTLRAKPQNCHYRYTPRVPTAPALNSNSHRPTSAPVGPDPFSPVPTHLSVTTFRRAIDTARGRCEILAIGLTMNNVTRQHNSSLFPAPPTLEAPKPARAYAVAADTMDEPQQATPAPDDSYVSLDPEHEDTCSSTTCFGCSASFPSTNSLHNYISDCNASELAALFTKPGPIVVAKPFARASLLRYQFRH